MPVSDDVDDLQALKQSHLLRLREALRVPLCLSDPRDVYRKRWRQVQYLADVFWRRWTREYLPLLRRRTKWQEPQRNFQEGDLVLLLERQLPRNEWPMGRVMTVRPGPDGLVRSAYIRTKDRELHRPVAKLCLLEEAVRGRP